MKTSKRLLSILLMLAMLVSMFTVMAFADNEAAGSSYTAEYCKRDGQPVAIDATGAGIHHSRNNWAHVHQNEDSTCAKDGNYWYAQCMDCGRWCYAKPDNTGKLQWVTTLNEPISEAKIAKKAHTIEEGESWEATGDIIGVKPHYVCTVCGQYFKDSAGNEPVDYEDLLIYPDVKPGACKHTNVDKYPETDTNYAYAYCKDCGKYFGTTPEGYIPADAEGKDSAKAFEKKPTVDTKAYDLTVDITGSNGKVYYKSGSKWVRIKDGETLQNIVTGTKVEFSADADSGYYVKWTYGGDDSYRSTKTVTVSKTSTLYVKFIKDSSSTCSHKWEQKFNKTYHWDECTKCGKIKNEVKHTIKTKTNKYGYEYEYCTKCNWTSDYSYNHSSSHKDYTYEDINSTYHWKTCKKCDYSVKEYHTWVKNTDRKTKDSYPYVCKYCDRLSKTAYTDLPFHDVSDKYWYYDDVLYAYLNGYMDGLSTVEFGADENTTRAQIVTILWRLTGEPRATRANNFNDVSSKAYYDAAVSWAVEAGVVNGFDAKTFKPNEFVTREQLAAILYRYAEYMNLSTRGASNLTKYDDYYQIGTWARDAMAWANYHGLINGVSYSRIDPKGNATRAQVAAILHRFAVEFA